MRGRSASPAGKRRAIRAWWYSLGGSLHAQPNVPRGEPYVKRLLCVMGVAAILAPVPCLAAGPRINAPFFPADVRYGEAAISWFGQVDASKNYTDVRVAYTSSELWVTLSIF